MYVWNAPSRFASQPEPALQLVNFIEKTFLNTKSNDDKQDKSDLDSLKAKAAFVLALVQSVLFTHSVSRILMEVVCFSFVFDVQ